MPTIQTQPDQLLSAALQMPEKEFHQFITRLFTAKASQRVPTLSERESELLLKINQGLSASRQERLNELIKKRRAETIRPTEARELKKLTAEVERFNVKRLRLLNELAAVCNVPLRKLTKQLGLKPVRHD